MSTTQSHHPSSRPAAIAGGEPDRASIEEGERPISVDNPTVAPTRNSGVVDVVLQVVMDRHHPHQVNPNDSAAVFRKYAESHHWTWVQPMLGPAITSRRGTLGA